jgi:hypothetical protein
MKSFKQYLEEAYLDRYIGAGYERETWNTSPGEARLWRTKTKKVGETDSHVINCVVKNVTADGNDVIYYALRKNARVIDATINGVEKDNAVHIETMATRPDSQLRMHEFIYYLASKLGKMVGAAHFSEGGKKVMDRVSTMPGVKLSYWKDSKRTNSVNAYQDSRSAPDSDKIYVVAQPV